MIRLQPLISVIVPIFNAEKYLRQCIDSILSQTYKNLEIILVDDGSQDDCPSICDKYAAKDKRIIVVHKENGGVSSARNVGLQKATGEWIGWVDPDDWIEPNMYCEMLEKAQKWDAEITVCSRAEIYPDRKVIRSWTEDIVLSREKALAELLENDLMRDYCCDKLFRVVLWEKIVFPEGRIFEDIAVMFTLFERANKVACLSKQGYNYRRHMGSAVSDTSLENKLNYFLAVKERYEGMYQQWPQFEQKMRMQCLTSAIEIWANYYYSPMKMRRKVYFMLDKVSDFCVFQLGKNEKIACFGLAGNKVLSLTPYRNRWAFFLAGLLNWCYKIKRRKAL